MLNGESKAGSWRIQTPFCTTASTEQPTEQWVQTVCLVTGAAAAATFASSAWADSITLNGMWRAMPAAPAVRPARSRNERRLMVAEAARARPCCSADLAPVTASPTADFLTTVMRSLLLVGYQYRAVR